LDTLNPRDGDLQAAVCSYEVTQPGDVALCQFMKGEGEGRVKVGGGGCRGGEIWEER